MPYPQLSNLSNWTRVSQKSESQISINSRRKNINLSYHKKLMKTGILPQSNLANMVCKFYDPQWFAILKLWESYLYDLIDSYDTDISYGLNSSRSNIDVWKSYDLYIYREWLLIHNFISCTHGFMPIMRVIVIWINFNHMIRIYHMIYIHPNQIVNMWSGNRWAKVLKCYKSVLLDSQ